MTLFKSLTCCIAGAMALLFAQVVSAAACNVDTFLGSANLGNSGDATEEAAMEAAAGGIDLTLDTKYNSGDAGFNIQVCPNDANTFYIDVSPDTPGYYLLKFGTGGTNATADTFFFQNIAELSELVFTSAQVQCLIGGPGCDQNENTGRLSHYTLYNGGSPLQTPEPATLGLLGIGALALAWGGRRRKIR